MARKDKISADQVRDAGLLAKSLADQGKGWATPKVEAVIDWAAPRVEHVWNSGVEAAAPRVVDAASKSRDAVDVAHDRLVDTVIPRIIAAMEDAAKAAKSSADSAHLKATAALLAAEKAAKRKQAPAKKGNTVAKTVGWVLVGTAVAGAGVLIWRRTQPVDDPWAEEYWDDATASTSTAPTTSVVDKAKHAVSGVAASVSDAADKAKELAADAVDKVKDSTGEAKDKVTKTADESTVDADTTTDEAKNATGQFAGETTSVQDAVDDSKKD